MNSAHGHIVTIILRRMEYMYMAQTVNMLVLVVVFVRLELDFPFHLRQIITAHSRSI
jgi:hypothetical protein